MNRLTRVAGWVGLVLLFPLLFLYAVSELVAPVWAVVVFLAIWVVLMVVAVRLVRQRPWVVLALPFVGLAVWFVALLLGEALLGWTA